MIGRVVVAAALLVAVCVPVEVSEAAPVLRRTTTSGFVSCTTTNEAGDAADLYLLQFRSGNPVTRLSIVPADGGSVLVEGDWTVPLSFADATLDVTWPLIDADTGAAAGVARLNARITPTGYIEHREFFERTNQWWKVSEDDAEVLVEGVLTVTGYEPFDIGCLGVRRYSEIFMTRPAAGIVHLDHTEAYCRVPTPVGLFIIGGYHDTSWHAETWTSSVVILDANDDIALEGSADAVPFAWDGLSNHYAASIMLAGTTTGSASVDYTLRLDRGKARTQREEEVQVEPGGPITTITFAETLQAVSVTGTVTLVVDAQLVTVVLDDLNCFGERRQTFQRSVYPYSLSLRS